MKYTIWRVTPSGDGFPLSNMGVTSIKERALEKARALNQRLRESEPESDERFIVRDEKGREVRDII
jgi:hypothetical protein